MVQCQKKEQDMSEETKSVWLNTLNFIRRSMEKTSKTVKIGIDIIQLALMTLPWSLMQKTIWRRNTEKRRQFMRS